MQFTRWQRACLMTIWGGSLAAIAACGSDMSTLTTAPPTSSSSSTQAVTSDRQASDSTSLIFQNDAGDVTAADVALVLAAYYLPNDRTASTLATAAENLLLPNESLAPLNPLPIGPNVNFAEVTGEPEGLITLEDAAVVQIAAALLPPNRTAAQLAEEAERFLNVLGITVRAIPGTALPPVTIEPFSVGQQINGSLTSGDRDNPIFTGSKNDDFTLENIGRNSVVRIDLRSVDFDTLIQLLDRDTGELVGFNDNSGSNRNSQLVFAPETGRNYAIRVTSSNGTTGDYTLSAFPISAPLVSGLQTSINGQLDDTDEVFETAFFVDYYRIAASSEDRLFRLTLNSTSFNLDPFLQVIDGRTGQIIASNDNGSGNNARLEFTASANVDYLVRATSASPQQTGGYVFTAEEIDPPVAPDIRSVSSNINNDVLSFEVTFADAIDPPSSDTGNPISGILYFDIDQTTATGENVAGGVLGADASINLNTQASRGSFVELVDFNSSQTQALVPITFDTNSFQVSLQLDDLSDIIGFTETGNVDYRFEIVNFQLQGDLVPDRSVGTTPGLLTDAVGDTIDLTRLAAATRVRLQQVPASTDNPNAEPGMQ